MVDLFYFHYDNWYNINLGRGDKTHNMKMVQEKKYLVVGDD